MWASREKPTKGEMMEMTRQDLRNQARSVLLNDTGRFWTRQEVLDKSNEFLGSFGEEHKIELPAISQAFMDLVFDDEVADATEDGRIRLNLDKFARWVDDHPDQTL